MVYLTSSDTTEATVPSSVTIPASQASVTFPIDAVDDDEADGTKTVTITATAPGYIDGADTLEVTDDDGPPLTLSIAADSIVESGGIAATTGTVTRNADTTGPLVVALSSSDISEATVPSSVTIPAGEASVQFAVNAVDDALVDGTQTVTITAHAVIGGAPVGLDSSFGTGGLATTSLYARFQPPHNAAAVQPDGKIVAASEVSSNSRAWRITRLNSDGSINTTFGANGVVDTTFSTQYPVPYKIVIQPDGKILVGGRFASGTGSIALCAITPMVR